MLTGGTNLEMSYPVWYKRQRRHCCGRRSWCKLMYLLLPRFVLLLFFFLTLSFGFCLLICFSLCYVFICYNKHLCFILTCLPLAPPPLLTTKKNTFHTTPLGPPNCHLSTTPPVLCPQGEDRLYTFFLSARLALRTTQLWILDYETHEAYMANFASHRSVKSVWFIKTIRHHFLRFTRYNDKENNNRYSLGTTSSCMIILSTFCGLINYPMGYRKRTNENR